MRFRVVLSALVAIGIGISAVGACEVAVVQESTGTGGGVGSVSSVTSSERLHPGFSARHVVGPGRRATTDDRRRVAAACASSADCGPGLSCIKDTDNDPVFGGGPAGGFCTAVCSSDADCPYADDVCLQLDPSQPGRCTLACTPGPAIQQVSDLFQPLDPLKCNGRADLRCNGVTGGSGVCLPTCGDDAQCEGGRACDPRLSVCVDQPNPGLPTGDICSVNASPTPCAGVCVGFS